VIDRENSDCARFEKLAQAQLAALELGAKRLLLERAAQHLGRKIEQPHVLVAPAGFTRRGDEDGKAEQLAALASHRYRENRFEAEQVPAETLFDGLGRKLGGIFVVEHAPLAQLRHRP